MEILNAKLVPILRERGVALHQTIVNTFVQAIADISTLGAEDKMEGGREEALTVDMEESLASTEASPCPRDCKDMLSRSHASLSSILLGHMIQETLADDWLSVSDMHHSLPYLLSVALVRTSWNKWPLVLDPLDLASRAIKLCRKDLVCLDATNRSESGIATSLRRLFVCEGI